jgi:hypothetical protein
MMAGNDAAGKLFEAMNEGSDALIDAVRAANDRGHRFSTALIEEAQEGQREAVELAKKWVAAPLDLLGLYGSLLQTTTKAQGRALDVTRQWFGEMSEAQKETRDMLQRMVRANRSAGEATVELTRGIFTRASEAVQSAAQSATAATGGGDGRKTSREPAKASEAPAGESQSNPEL